MSACGACAYAVRGEEVGLAPQVVEDAMALVGAEGLDVARPLARLEVVPPYTHIRRRRRHRGPVDGLSPFRVAPREPEDLPL